MYLTSYQPAAPYAEVYLNGEKLQYCVRADTELGQVERYQRDGTGAFIAAGDQLLTEVLHGEVRIEVPAEYRHLLTLP